MSTQGDDSSDKSFEPTQKKIDDARKKGDIAKSADVNTAASYLGLVIAVSLAGSGALGVAGETLAALIERSDMLVGTVLGSGGGEMSGHVALVVSWAVLPLFLLPGLAALAALFAQRGIVFAPDKVIPKLSRLSPVQNAKNKYGGSGMFEFAKSAVKLVTIGITLFLLMWGELDTIIGSAAASPVAVTAVMGELMIKFLIATTIIAATIAAIDMGYQQYEHRRKLMMTLKEMRDEAKESDGDPYMKSRRRQKAEEIATNRMLGDVPKADVVIVNPTHFAVALTWARTRDTAPVCVAKGQDEIALKIREIAEEAGVPIHSDAPAARAIFATIDIGQEILPDHYPAVAAAIQFADRMRGLAGKEGQP